MRRSSPTVTGLALAAWLCAAPADAQPCIGDCGNDGEVTVDEVLTGLNIALGLREIDECEAMDADGSRSVTVDEIITALSLALTGCPGSGPTRTPTPTRSATPTRTPSAPPSATATASRTPTATPPPALGPVVTYFGLTRADRQAVSPSGVTDEGIPIFERPFGGGFLVVVEGRPGTSQVPLGQCNTSYDEFDPSVVPDVQILSSRDLGRGDGLVGDGDDAGDRPASAVAPARPSSSHRAAGCPRSIR